MNELDVARAIAVGTLPSPTEFHNAHYFALRVSGTGVAWRPQHKEFGYRDPGIWLSQEMVDRCRGLVLIMAHPGKAVLDTAEFANRVVGVITFAWVRGDELWAIARILDGGAAEFIHTGAFDTSPSAIFAPGEGRTIKIGDDVILIEGEPVLLDHLAIVTAGVWSKGNRDNAGVEVTAERAAA